MQVEFLHTTKGDKKKNIDTTTATGRKEAAKLIQEQIKKGTAIFLQRGTKTYRVKSYDAKTDSLVVVTETKKKEKTVRAKSTRGKVAAVPPIAGGSE